MDPEVELPPKTSFRCKNCRQLLFRDFVHGQEDCSSYFINQPSWEKTENNQNQKKFKCPKCQTKIGEVIYSGKMCNCKEWVTPAFQVHKNKVDRIVQTV